MTVTGLNKEDSVTAIPATIKETLAAAERRSADLEKQIDRDPGQFRVLITGATGVYFGLTSVPT